ncbi:MAG: type VI secretion system tube protein Hcp [Planctomycetes bacterium]|nr:type VI secretion system tube protein Hcp [Planctomycetota bacterium]
MSYTAYLKLEGIDGDCGDPARAGWMLIDSFNQNVNGPQERGGRTTMTDVSVTKLADRATPQLARATAEGRRFREALIELCVQDGSKAKFMEIRLTNVHVTNYGLSGAPQSDARTPFENLMLAFEKIEWVYLPGAFAPGREDAEVCRAGWSPNAKPAAV